MKIKIKEKYLRIICLILLIILVFVYGHILQNHFRKKAFAEKNMEVYHNNEETVFKVDKIILCSSANAIDRSEEKNLQDLSIYQYTDIAVYIDNGEDLTSKNTINKIYIDNIELDGTSNIGSKSLNYKSILDFGLKQELKENNEYKENIYFNVVHTNEENENANYTEATFYTDCSNPLTLEYLNYDLINGYKMNENNSVAFDGSILQNAGVKTEDIDCNIKFRINIVNNQNEKYSCWINFKNPLDDIYKGTTMKSKIAKGKKYKFFREV